MPAQIITTDDLREFKIELLSEIKEALENQKAKFQKKYLKSAELIEMLQISHGTLQTLRINGTLPYSKIGGCIFYDAEDVHRIMQENRIHNKF